MSRVLMFGWEFPPYNSGGLGVACHGLTKSMSKQGTEVIFVLPKKGNISDLNPGHLRIVFADENSGIKFHPIDSLLSPYLTSGQYEEILLSKTLPLYGRNLVEEVYRYALCARVVARKEKFDIIHAHDWLSFPAGIEAKKISKKPLVVHVHATEFDRTGGNGVNKQVYEIEKEGMEKADAVIAVSNFTKNLITRHYGIYPEKVNVVHNGIDLSEYPATQGSNQDMAELKKAGYKIVLFVGRITLQKGPDYFLKTAKRVLEYCPKTVFIIAGSGDMEHQIIREAAWLGISDKVFFAGFLRGEELNRLYRMADLYVLTSVSEPFGITPLESLANATPILISKQSGVSEVVSHALKADFWDVDEMTNKIVSVLNHESLKQCLAEQGKEEVKKITWDAAAQKCLGIYNKVLQSA